MTATHRRHCLGLLPALVLATALAGCGSARTVVVEPVKSATRYAALTIVADTPTVEVPAADVSGFEASLRKGLYDSGRFVQGDELRLVYAVVSLDPGDQLQRWYSVGIGNRGEGTLVVQVRYLDKAGQEVARTQVKASVSSGLLGGSMGDALDRAAQDVVAFTVASFSAK